MATISSHLCLLDSKSSYLLRTYSNSIFGLKVSRSAISLTQVGKLGGHG